MKTPMDNQPQELVVPSERVKVAATVDVCVIGGSCTGVFAAIRAARLGATVALVERQNRFGGVATCGLVGMWHTLHDYTRERQIIGGLTFETLERLERRHAVSDFRNPDASARGGVRFNPEELTLELDELVAGHDKIKVWLNTAYSRPLMNEDGRVDAVIIENKSGRSAIRAKVFIDASGDGVLCRDAGLPTILPPHPQPPTACARLEGWESLGALNIKELCDQYRDRFPNLPGGYAWGMSIPGTSAFMLAGTRVLECDCDDADAITRAEIESRRQVRALMDMFRAARPEGHLSLLALPSLMGIREGRHIVPLRLLRGEDMLAGTRFPDAIGNGTYPVDIHNDRDATISFKRLDGGYTTYSGGKVIDSGRWLPEGQVLPFYQFTLGALIPQGTRNLICAGRMLGADREAFGAIRVMVNLNQCGEAAGVAAWQALDGDCDLPAVDPGETRALLARGGSIII